jgi:hypothetical protein
MKDKINKNKIEYVKLILNISDEVGISPEESKNIVDTALQYLNVNKINYDELKKEILSFIVINMFSLICKL